MIAKILCVSVVVLSLLAISISPSYSITSMERAKSCLEELGLDEDFLVISATTRTGNVFIKHQCIVIIAENKESGNKTIIKACRTRVPFKSYSKWSVKNIDVIH